MRAAIVDELGAVIARSVRPTPRDGSGSAALIDLAADLLRRHPASAAVIGVPGRVDYEGGFLEYAPNLPPGWIAGLTE